MIFCPQNIKTNPGSKRSGVFIWRKLQVLYQLKYLIERNRFFEIPVNVVFQGLSLDGGVAQVGYNDDLGAGRGLFGMRNDLKAIVLVLVL